MTETRTVRPGLRPAFVMAGLLLVGANLRTAITSVGPVMTDIQHSLGLNSVGASVLISLPVLAFAVVSPFAPGLARRFGLEPALGAALAGLAVGIALRSVPSRAALWGGTALLGVAIAVMNVLLPALVKRDFPTRIGQVTGTYSAVQSTFAAVAAGVAVPIAGVTDSGWRWALGLWAGLAVVGLAVFAPQLRRHTAPPEEDEDDTTLVGTTPAPAGRNPWTSLLGWQITAFMGVQSVTYYVLITWLPSIEKAAGIGADTAGIHLLLLNAFAIAGSLGCSTLIPRFADQRPLAVAGPAVLVLAMAGLLARPHLAAVWDSLAGISGGACIVLALSLFGLRTNDHTQAATLSGMAQSVGYLLAAAGPIAAGALHDGTGTWRPVVAGILLLAVLLTGLGLPVGRRRVIG